MNTLEHAFVTTTYQDGIAVITFGTPLSNSLPGELLSKIADAITDAGERSDIVAIVLRSYGQKAFCAGASFVELSNIFDEESGTKFFMGFANVILAIRNAPKIVIGRIQGKAVGGGVGLAAACDIALATRYSAIRLSELAIGIGPFVIGPAVERKTGVSAFAWLSLTPNDWQTPEWAMQNGLYNLVFKESEDLDEWLEIYLDELRNSNPEALAGLKAVYHEQTRHWEKLLPQRAAMSGRLVLSEFTKNAITQFNLR